MEETYRETINRLFNVIEPASKRMYESGQISIVKATRRRVENAITELENAVEDLAAYEQDMQRKNATHPPLQHKYRESVELAKLQQK
ncbi:hypothetical protein HB884_14730 [Listeria booriae]|uniref:Uncharacterized protein n=1 Tax=Listeria booriae TaxID=1552123 RepID=A0A7X0XC22_9LIST|nr:hypothetical protein [Listeria booriae]MBC1491436.1 hypothetical protein [Listeria booriae]MBC1525462.1 hypothetical protein [Listeria booriae]MBC6150078.1 hypothetical protein [Listeria booriae]